MNIAERHQRILKELKEKGSISVRTLGSLFDVSNVTIRKDLDILESKKLLFRTHGGATLQNPYTSDQPISEKEKIKTKEKESIAAMAQSLIGDTDSIILGSGSTVTAFARQINTKQSLRVITSALTCSLALARRKNVDVIQLGGKLRSSSSSVVGDYAEQFLHDITCGVLFLGVDGIDIDFGITTTDLDEAKLNQRCIKAAQIVVVLADSSKFDKRGFGRICDFGPIHYIVTDSDVCSETVEALEKKGVHVMIAQPQ